MIIILEETFYALNIEFLYHDKIHTHAVWRVFFDYVTTSSDIFFFIYTIDNDRIILWSVF